MRGTRTISEIKKLNDGGNQEGYSNQTQTEIKNIVTELVLGGGHNTEHMVVLDSR